MRAYVSFRHFMDHVSPIVWLPLLRSPSLRWLRIIPLSRYLLGVFALGRIKNTLETLDRVYRTRSVLDDGSSGHALWTELHEQAESMNSILRAPRFSTLIVAICGIVLILLIGQNESARSSLLFKLLIATATLSPDKFAEAASEPDAPYAFFSFGLLLWVSLTFCTPIVVYHFRFCRGLFNHPEIIFSGKVPPDLSIGTVWKEISFMQDSLYQLEIQIFSALDEAAPREPPFDLYAIMSAFGYHAAGPGFVVGFLAYKVYQTSPQLGLSLAGVAFVNAAIGLTNVIFAVGAGRERARKALALSKSA
jgi:hypothetical protein